MSALVVVATVVAGGLAAVVRAAVVRLAPRLGTALVNIIGTLVLALVLVAHGRGVLGVGTVVVVGVGLSGSLTTFSGWMAVLADGFAEDRLGTLLLDVIVPLVAAVAITVGVFATLG
jgi:fluoride ion exporter CrcB/FEX